MFFFVCLFFFCFFFVFLFFLFLVLMVDYGLLVVVVSVVCNATVVGMW